jgi:ribonucleoside-diphosphate reductase alpha chain
MDTDYTLPIKSVDPEQSLEDRLTDNVQHAIGPQRYFARGDDGEPTEDWHDVFERVARNVSLAELIYDDQAAIIEPDDLADWVDDDTRQDLFDNDHVTDYDIDGDWRWADERVAPYLDTESIWNELPEDHDARTWADRFEQAMRQQLFMPNSPTLMNAGTELQQLSACFVDSPDDDLGEINSAQSEAAEIFQCLTSDERVMLVDSGAVSVSDVEIGDEVQQAGGTTGTVVETHAYDDADVMTVSTDIGLQITGTPNHELFVVGGTSRIDELEPGDDLELALNWFQDTGPVTLETVERTLWENDWSELHETIVEMNAEGKSDYEIAESVDVCPSTVQRHRTEKLGLGAASSTGRQDRSPNFDVSQARVMYEDGASDPAIAEQIGVSRSAIKTWRHRNDLVRNEKAVNDVVQPEMLTPQLAELVGLWVGDGSYHEDGIRFHVAKDDVIETISRIARDQFDYDVSISPKKGCVEVGLYSSAIKRFWKANFGESKENGAASARIPDCIWNADRDTAQAFLKGLYEADGTVLRGEYASLTTVSEDLATDVQQLLLGLGIPARVWDDGSNNTGKTRYQARPTTSAGNDLFFEHIGVGESYDVTRSIDQKKPVKEWSTTVDDVVDSGTDTVYDITVEDDHEYVASSVRSHNSGGGVGYAFHHLRPKGALVSSTGGVSSGPLSFMELFDTTCNTIKQGGKRRGAQMGIMHAQHPDIGRFVVAKRGEDRFSNFNISVGLTEEFMDAVRSDELYTLYDPTEGDGLTPEGGDVPFDAVAETIHFYDPQFEDAWNDEFDKPGAGLDGKKVEDNFWRDFQDQMQDPDAFEAYRDRIDLELGEPIELPARFVWQAIIDGAHNNGEPGFVDLTEINREHSFDVDEHPEHTIHATNPSLAPGTRVLTNEGVKPIEELTDQEFSVPTLDGDWAPALCRQSGVDEDVLEVELSNGKTYTATPDHDWPVKRSTDRGYPDEYQKVETADLQEGDMLSLEPVDDLGYGDQGQYDDGFLIGYCYGDGSVTEREDRVQYGFTFPEETVDDGTMDAVLAKLEEITGTRYQPTLRNRGGEDWCEVHASSSVLHEYFDSFGVENKRAGLPTDAFENWSEATRRGFIDGLFSTDGHIDTSQNRIVLTSAHCPLIDDLSDLLGFYGVKHHVRAGTTELDGSMYDRWDLTMSKAASKRFRELFNLTVSRKANALTEIDEPVQNYTSMSHYEVVDVRDTDETTDVWDLSVYDDTHTFHLSHAVTGNCSEQPLEEYEACNLGHVNVSLLADEDAPMWAGYVDDVTTDVEDPQTVDSSVVMAQYINHALDLDELRRVAELGTRFLDNVVTMSKFPLDEITESVRNKRKIGLGVMGVHQLMLQLGIEYGSPASFEFGRQLMRHIDEQATVTSHDLALDRGVFPEYPESKWIKSAEYPDWFRRHAHQDPDEWADAGFQMRNHNVTTVAPTGTTSMIGDTTGGIEPLYNVAFFKNVGDDIQGDEMLVEFDDYFLRTLEANGLDVDQVKEETETLMLNNEFDDVTDISSVPDELARLFVTTQDVSFDGHIEMQAAFQDHVDSAISKTLNAPNDASIEDIGDAVQYATGQGIKGFTVYRDGSREEQVKTTRVDNELDDELTEEQVLEWIGENVEQDSTFQTILALVGLTDADVELETSVEESVIMSEADD